MMKHQDFYPISRVQINFLRSEICKLVSCLNKSAFVFFASLGFVLTLNLNLNLNPKP